MAGAWTALLTLLPVYAWEHHLVFLLLPLAASGTAAVRGHLRRPEIALLDPGVRLRRLAHRAASGGAAVHSRGGVVGPGIEVHRHSAHWSALRSGIDAQYGAQPRLNSKTAYFSISV